MGEQILKMSGIEKRFSGVYALKKANFELNSGEIHALMGENGAGKSTLMKVLCGIHQPDGGKIELFGSEVHFRNISESQRAGVAIIHQELNMMNHLTVAQNIYIGREPMIGGAIIDDRKMENDAAELFGKIGVKIDPSQILGTLTVGKQQMVEIAKAISHHSKLLILDEPTAALTQPEVEELFKIMKDLKKKGIGMIYISHRMDEIGRISDRITVMRDGEYVGTLEAKDYDRDRLVQMMVGRVIYGDKKEKSNVNNDAPTVLEVRNLNRAGTIRNVSFKLKKGEILGFSGLMGAGRTEVARAVYGADKYDSGEIFINGELVKIKEPSDAVKHGICYLSEDRKRYGLLLAKSVAENSVLANLDDYINVGWINDKRINDAAAEINSVLKTKTPSVFQELRNLSGGNQQKVIVARWLLKNCDIFIFDEPTRGIDIGAKSEMYELMEKLASQGKSIIMISSELSEIQRLSDRVIVMCEGRITAELDIAQASQQEIMKYATMRE
ncbi:MAG: sugar ABC transporter ATP-binding protein [Ruminococcaceae bacterium]|nr:sugar ABC transporter ATP-binding protein [Oscillospiraceae bacterium]